MTKLVAAAVIVVLMAALPADAQKRASSPEQQYCEALSDLYVRYVGNPETEPRNVRRNDAEAEEALITGPPLPWAVHVNGLGVVGATRGRDARHWR